MLFVGDPDGSLEGIFPNGEESSFGQNEENSDKLE